MPARKARSRQPIVQRQSHDCHIPVRFPTPRTQVPTPIHFGRRWIATVSLLRVHDEARPLTIRLDASVVEVRQLYLIRCDDADLLLEVIRGLDDARLYFLLDDCGEMATILLKESLSFGHYLFLRHRVGMPRIRLTSVFVDLLKV